MDSATLPFLRSESMMFSPFDLVGCNVEYSADFLMRDIELKCSLYLKPFIAGSMREVCRGWSRSR